MIRSYGWAITILAMLSVFSGIMNYAAIEEQTGLVEFSIAAHKQAQLYVSVQSGIIGIQANAKQPLLDKRKFDDLQQQLARDVVDLAGQNRVVAAMMDKRPFLRGSVPPQVRDVYLRKPYQLAVWLQVAAERGIALVSLTRDQLRAREGTWAPEDVAMAAGTTVKGFAVAAAIMEEAAISTADRMEKLHIGMAVLALLVIAAEAGFIFGPLVARVRREQRRAEEALATIETLAFRDSVTGDANRTYFRKALLEACAGAPSSGFGVILCDLDKFKSVNDGFGHQAGDRLLCEIARRIRAAVGPDDLGARLGGDEFAMLVREIGSTDELARMIERIRRELTVPWEYDGIRLDVSVSIGGALCPMHSIDPDRLLAYADRALYEAKQAEQHTSVFDRAQRDRSDGDSALLRALPQAFADSQFELHYQPKIRLLDNRIEGVEALVRWRHPELGLLGPATFLPVVYRGGKIAELTRMVVDMAGAKLAQWRLDGLPLPSVAINMPENMLISRLGLECLSETIERYALSGDMFTIEITEDVFISRAASAIQSSVEAITELGVRVAFDDFGTGFASLSHLRQFRFDELKIDRSFVTDIGRSAMGEEIIHALVSLARALGKDLVAEGVETEEQLRFLRGEGCTSVQGYFFCRPLPAHELEEWVRQRDGGRLAAAPIAAPRLRRA